MNRQTYLQTGEQTDIPTQINRSTYQQTNERIKYQQTNEQIETKIHTDEQTDIPTYGRTDEDIAIFLSLN